MKHCQFCNQFFDTGNRCPVCGGDLVNLSTAVMETTVRTIEIPKPVVVKAKPVSHHPKKKGK